jgi:hypothetical protein
MQAIGVALPFPQLGWRRQMNLRDAQALQIALRETPTGFDQIPSMKFAARSMSC